jgi:hypothetical protein
MPPTFSKVLLLLLLLLLLPGAGLRDRVSAVLGAKVAAVMQPIEVELAAEGVKVTG